MNPTAPKIACSEVQQKLVALLFRELKVEPTDRLLQHIGRCLSCRQEAERLKKTIQYLRLDPDPPPGEERIDRILASLRSRFTARATRTGIADAPQPPRRRLGPIAAILLLPLGALLAVLALNPGEIRERLRATLLRERTESHPEPERASVDPIAAPETSEPSPTSPVEQPRPDPADPADLGATLEALIDRLAVRIADLDERDEALPPEREMLSSVERTFLREHGPRLRDLLPSSTGIPPSRQGAALLLLASLGDPRPSDLRRTLEALEGPDAPSIVQRAALRAASVWKAAEAWNRALAIVADPSAPQIVRLAAARSLGPCSSGVDLSPLSDLLARTDLPQAVQTEIVGALREVQGGRVGEFLGSLLDRGSSSEIRLAAARLLVSGPYQAGTDRVLSALDSFPEPTEQARLLLLLRETGSEHELLYLVREILLYGSHDEDVLSTALDVAGTIARRTQAVEHLEEVYRNPSLPAELRGQAVEWIEGDRSGPHGRAAVTVMRSATGSARAEAARMLGPILSAPERAAALAEALDDPHPEVRREAARSLAIRGPLPEGKLRGLASNPDEPAEVRVAAAEALASAGIPPAESLGDPSLVPDVLDRILARPTPSTLWKPHARSLVESDPYGRTTLFLSPREVVRQIEKHHGLPLEIEPDLEPLLGPEVEVPITPGPALSLEAFLSACLEAIGLDLRRESGRLTLGNSGG